MSLFCVADVVLEIQLKTRHGNVCPQKSYNLLEFLFKCISITNISHGVICFNHSSYKSFSKVCCALPTYFLGNNTFHFVALRFLVTHLAISPR